MYINSMNDIKGSNMTGTSKGKGLNVGMPIYPRMNMLHMMMNGGNIMENSQ